MPGDCPGGGWAVLELTGTLDECRIVQSDEVDLTKLPRDDLGTRLIPDDIAAKPLAHGNPVIYSCLVSGR